MATVDEVRDEILVPMRSLYRVPYGIENPEQALVQFTNVLTRYKASTLAAGWKRFIENYTERTWPSIAELRGVIDFVDREERKLRESRMVAAETPDPHEAFCTSVLAFIKRDERTFVDFRDAGVRAVDGKMTLRFDDDKSADFIRGQYGDQLDAFIGQHIEIEAETHANAKAAWRQPRWEKDKPYVRSAA